jgi:type 1 glutamine amidotransferase
LAAFTALGCTSSQPDSNSAEEPTNPSVLLFSRTTGYRHDSIEDGIAALTQLAGARSWHLESTEDAATFTDEGLGPFDVVVFLSTTGDVLDDAQQQAFERFVRAGNGFVGIHAASDTEYDWPWYGELVGAYFRAHPAVQSASVSAEGSHPSIAGLPTPWNRTDEWYAFQENPRAKVQVLLTLDESTYSPGEGTMGADHPVAWLHSYDGGRAFYTALGHTRESYGDPLFLQHLEHAIEWAAGR